MLRNLEDPHSASSAKLMAHLEQVKSSKGQNPPAKKTSSGGTGTGNADGGTVYELLMKPDSAKLEEKERLAKLDKRIEALETALGSAPDSMSSLALETSNKSVLAAVETLSARTSLFEPGHLDHVEGRLAALQAKLTALAAERSKEQQNGDLAKKEAKINELFDLVQRTQTTATALPTLVDRMESLQELHERASQFGKAVAQLDAVQAKLQAGLADNEAALKVTREKFAENLESINNNFAALEKRIEKLSKK